MSTTSDAARRICVVTGSRADYGHLEPVMRAIAAEPALRLQLVVTGAHLAPEFGRTIEAIERDGYAVDAQVDMLLASDTPVGVAKSMGLALIGFADAFARLRPDLLCLLGDRYEILAAAQAALVARIPVAHIAGGDITEGAYDDAMRHALTKLAHLHFVTTAAAGARVRQMGEDPARIHVVGSPSLDSLARLQLLSREALEADLGVRLRARNLVVTFHPVTLDPAPALAELGELLQALDALGPGTGIVFTAANADDQGRAINAAIERWCAARPHAVLVRSLGQLRYFSLVAQADAVVGNSSSGVYEVPSLGKPSVNIGDRQKGRESAASVIHCPPDAEAIREAILRACAMDCSGVVNPYGDGHAAERICAVLRALPDPAALVRKRFFALEGA